MYRIQYLFILLAFNITNILAQPGQEDIIWPTLSDAPWPMIKNDPQFTGRSSYKGPQTSNIAWTADMSDGIFSGPVIGIGGNLYFGSYCQLDSADHFYSYTPDGKLRWDYKSGTNRPPQSGILIDSSQTIHFGSLDQYFYALNPDGTLKWRYETTAPIVEQAMPNIDLEGRLYITNGLGELYSINNDGSLNWNVKYENGFYKRSPVFSPDGNTLYIFGADSNLFALNLDGTIKWKFSFIGSAKAPIVDSFGNIYFGGPYHFYSLSPDGNIRWKNGMFIFGNHSMPTIDNSGNLYSVANDTVCCPYYPLLISLNNNGDFRWKYTLNDEETDDFWQPLICDSEGTVYVGSTFGHYYYAISSNGELKWKLPLNDYQVDNTGAIAEDGTLYLGVHITSLNCFQEKTLIAIKDSTVSAIDDQIFSYNYKLEQCYPNPFNPSTTIELTLPKSEFVTLKVYSILGEEITTLVAKNLQAGNHTYQFDGSDLASGVYLYRIEAVEFTQVMKMILIK